MTTKVLDLLLQLSVAGTQDAKELQKAVDGLKNSVSSFKGRSLDDILNGTKAKGDLDLIVDKSKTLFDLLLKGGRTPLDLNLDKVKSDLDLVVVKGKQVFDLFTKNGRTPVDLNLGKAKADLDVVLVKGRQLVDLFVQAGRTKIDFNLSKIEQEATRAANAIQRLRERELRELERQQNTAAAAANQHSQSIAGLGREFLLFRRVLFGLGIIEAVRQVGQLIQAFDKTRQSLAAVFGESNAAEEFNFIRETAERLGLSINDLAQQYARFSSAARALGLNQQIVRDNFLAVAEAGAKLGLSAQDVEGALVAIQQIASKGKLSLEELRQQLGDRIPGAVAIAAKALGVTQARLFALVEQGQITSEVFLTKFPAALRASFGTDVNTRVETTTATIQRFQNALSELIDTAVRAGALDAFLGIVKELTAVFRDPNTIQSLKEFSKSVADVTRFARENATAIKTLIVAYAGFRIFQGLTSSLIAFTGAFSRFVSVSSTGAAAVASTAGSLKQIADASDQGAGKVTAMAKAVGTLALAARSPIVIAISGLAALDAALLEAYIAKLDRARDKATALGEAQRTAFSDARIVQSLNAQIAALQEYSGTVALTEREVNSLSEEGLRFYKDAAEGAKKLSDLQTRAAEARIDQLQQELKVIALTNDKSTEALVKLATYKDEIARLQKQQEASTAQAQSFATSLDLIGQRSAAQGIAFDENVRRLQVLGRSFETAAKSGQQLSALKFDALSKDAQNIVASFRRVVEAGEGFSKAFQTAIPKDFADLGVKAISDVGNAFALLAQEADVSATAIGEHLAKALDKLLANDLQKFAVQAQGAFELSKLSAQGLSLLLDGQLRASLKNLGLEADSAGTRVSKTFAELVSNFRNVAENAKVTGAQLRGAIQIATETAKTREELLLLQATIEQTGIAGGKMGADIADALTRLTDKIQLTVGLLDSALGDSFNRLGIKTKENLKAIGDQAFVDFNRVRASGNTTALELEAAFRKAAEEITKANNGIPPIKLVVQAVDFNAFDLIVKAAEKASERVKRAIQDAIPLADTREKLRELSDAVKESFDKGKLSVDDFGKLVTEIGFKLREMTAKPLGELAAAADLLGVKTKDQLKAIADNAREAFQDISASGQFTNAELAKGAQQYLDAYKAANDGVIDSFDPVVAKALDVLKSVDGVTDALTRLKDKALEPIDTGNLRDRTILELQKQLADTVKMYRELGIANVENLQIVQAIQAELNRKGQEAAKAMADAAGDASKAATDNIRAAAGPAAPGPGGAVVGGVHNTPTFNFHFNNAVISPEDVRRTIIPVLNDINKRTR
jgi:tape measure domain-containing protein